jgi:prepilin peptidase CpaA
MHMSFVQIAGLGIAALACGIDVRRRRIPNWLTFGAAIAGLVYRTSVEGAAGFTDAGAGWFVGAAMFFLPFALGGLGAGDVKLVAALGAWFGLADAMWLALYTGVAGGVVALVVALLRGYLRQALANVGLLFMHWRVAGLRALPELTIYHGQGPKLAYGVSIFVGTVVTIWLR